MSLLSRWQLSLYVRKCVTSLAAIVARAATGYEPVPERVTLDRLPIFLGEVDAPGPVPVLVGNNRFCLSQWYAKWCAAKRDTDVPFLQ